MVPKFKTGHYYFHKPGYILYISQFSETTGRMIVKWLNKGDAFYCHSSDYSMYSLKDLGSNDKAVQVLLGNKE